MKKFEFRLEKAWNWRQMQMRLAEAALEGMHAELRDLQQRVTDLSREKEQAGKGLMAAGSVTGVELAFLESFRQATDASILRIHAAQGECRRRIEAQILAVMERRREARALEQLKEKKLQAWQSELNRELDQQASESFLARWNREAAH